MSEDGERRMLGHDLCHCRSSVWKNLCTRADKRQSPSSACPSIHPHLFFSFYNLSIHLHLLTDRPFSCKSCKSLRYAVSGGTLVTKGSPSFRVGESLALDAFLISRADLVIGCLLTNSRTGTYFLFFSPEHNEKAAELHGFSSSSFFFFQF